MRWPVIAIPSLCVLNYKALHNTRSIKLLLQTPDSTRGNLPRLPRGIRQNDSRTHLLCLPDTFRDVSETSGDMGAFAVSPGR
jgi:hypothetical protein